MKNPIENGLAAANNQPAKTLTKRATDFIATCTRYATADAGYILLCVLLLIQTVLMALGVLQ